MIDRALHEAADALRRHEQAGKKLNQWYLISHGQRSRWLAKAKVVLEAYGAAARCAENERLREELASASPTSRLGWRRR